MTRALVALLVLLLGEPIGAAVRSASLSGESLPAYPFFHFVRTFGPDETVEAGVDPSRFPDLIGTTCDLYVVATKTAAAWDSDPSLVDIRSTGPRARNIAGTSITANRFKIASAGQLDTDAGIGLGRGHDVVLDCNRDGVLNGDDVIDGRTDEPGLYAVHDTTEPGPLAVTEVDHDGGQTFLRQRIYYPTNIAELGRSPLVVVSHGWTHDYTWYDHIGSHLASYGYVVMSHRNNVGAGNAAATHTAAATTLTNTDYFLGNLATIAGGALEGHVDNHRIAFIGHSTGAEGVVRAHTRVRTGHFVPQQFDVDDIALVSAIAPVSFLDRDDVDPHDVSFHMFLGAADTDTSGAPLASYTQPVSIYERGFGNKQFVYVQGAGHGDFHSGAAAPFAEGPDLIGKDTTHQVVRGYYLPLMELYLRENLAGEEFFTRMYEDFHPPGIDTGVIVANEFSRARNTGEVVIDDYQSHADTGTSSSGGTVSLGVSNAVETRMEDLDGSFFWNGTQPSNGMTRARFSDDDPSCIVFDWSGETAHYELEIVPGLRDLSGLEHLSFRAAQGTRHPWTDGLDSPMSFVVTLRDGSGTASSIDFGLIGRLTRPYERWGFGDGLGWANEFVTVRLGLAEFEADGSGIDLTDVVAVRFGFGPGFGASLGRIGLDDVELIPPFAPAALVLEGARSPQGARFAWPALVGARSYNVYRGTIPGAGGLATYDHACFERADLFGDGARVTTDDQAVPPGIVGFYYLVSTIREGQGATLGRDSAGVERPIPSPCP